VARDPTLVDYNPSLLCTTSIVTRLIPLPWPHNGLFADHTWLFTAILRAPRCNTGRAAILAGRPTRSLVYAPMVCRLSSCLVLQDLGEHFCGLRSPFHQPLARNVEGRNPQLILFFSSGRARQKRLRRVQWLDNGFSTLHTDSGEEVRICPRVYQTIWCG
jgi:hypothetical protein